MHFNTKTDAAQNLIDNFFFLNLTVRGPFHRKDFKSKKYGSEGPISEKMEASLTKKLVRFYRYIVVL